MLFNIVLLRCPIGSLIMIIFSSVQFSSVAQSCLPLCNPMDCSMSGLCPSPTPRVYSNSCPWSWWYYPTISSSVVPFSSCLLYFPTSRSFPMSQFFVSGRQGIGASASVSVLPIFRVDFLSDWLVGSPCCLRTLKSPLQHHSSKASVLQCSTFFMVQLLHPLYHHWKNQIFD